MTFSDAKKLEIFKETLTQTLSSIKNRLDWMVKQTEVYKIVVPKKLRYRTLTKPKSVQGWSSTGPVQTQTRKGWSKYALHAENLGTVTKINPWYSQNTFAALETRH